MAQPTITGLPQPEEIKTMSPLELSRFILRLCDEAALVNGEVMMSVNEFFAHAAVRLAKVHCENADAL